MTAKYEATVVRLPPDLMAALRAAAEDQDRTIAAIVRRAVRQYLEAEASR